MRTVNAIPPVLDEVTAPTVAVGLAALQTNITERYLHGRPERHESTADQIQSLTNDDLVAAERLLLAAGKVRLHVKLRGRGGAHVVAVVINRAQ